MPTRENPWTITVRVFGGRLDHQAQRLPPRRRGRGAAASGAGPLRIACTGRYLWGAELDNALCGRPCPGCARRIWAWEHPDTRQRQRAALRGQDALPLPLLD